MANEALKKPSDDAAAKKAQEDAAIQKLEDEKSAIEAATLAARQQQELTAQRESFAEKAANPKTRKVSGDIDVVCLIDDSRVCLGGRTYAFKKGAEIPMHPEHAEEMRQQNYVAFTR